MAGCPGPDGSDAGVDAPDLDGAPDGADVDGGGRCTIDDDCDDGTFCNGVETCVMGACVAGSDPCDDGIDCTLDACIESRRLCRSDGPDLDRDRDVDVNCLDATGTPLGSDCDDTNPDRFGGNRELCDLVDQDCDDTTFGGVDDDRDGYESSACCNGPNCGTDCDDARLGSFPGATEVCDGLDQDCDGTPDDGLFLDGFLDRDGDGWGGTMAMTACPGTPGWAPRGGDCNDDPGSLTARAENPGQPEICDGFRNDCTARPADEGAGAVAWYADLDGDGYGAAASGITRSCSPVSGASLLDTDCNDDDRMINPAATERCNGIDDNCDGSANFRIAANDFEDDDGDGLTDLMCPDGTDCNDADPSSGPGEPERCDLRDNDCDTRVDEGAPSSIYYRDIDRDGFGALASGSVVACMPVPGYVLNAGDCSDMDPTRRPGATETCDSADEDCDAAIDEAPASTECSLPYTTSYCLAGRCFVDTCERGRADCDGRSENGCEIDVLSDAFNCGSCGVMCPGTGVCGAGICTHSHASMVSDAVTWNLPRMPRVIIDTPAPGATIAYRTDEGTLSTTGTGFFENLATTPVEIFFTVPSNNGPMTVQWRVLHAPGLVEDVQVARFNVDDSPTGSSSTARGAIVENLNIAGSGPVAGVAPGSSITITYDIQLWERAGFGPVSVQLWVGTGGDVDCVSAPVGSVYPGVTLARSVTVTAPTVPGIYPLSLVFAFECGSAVSLPGTNDVGYLLVGD